MATEVIMPRQGQSVESCIITKWHKNKGDYVNKGDLLFSYETDKAAFDEEAEVSGVLLEILFREDDDVPVLSNVCIIGEEGEEVSDTDGDILKISPRAKNLAIKTGAEYSGVSGSGPEGRIIEKDIRQLQQTGHSITPAAREALIGKLPLNQAGTGLGGKITVSDIESPTSVVSSSKSDQFLQDDEKYSKTSLSNIRKTIAHTMHQSLSTSAQLTLNTSFDASTILSYRKQIKSSRQHMELENITLNDIIIYAVSRVLPQYKELNANYQEDTLLAFKNVHMGVAVDTERGLMVPTIFNCDLKSLNEISKEASELIGNCREGAINPDLLRGGTFTITNLGSLGIESFTPIINPPQTGILGVNNIVQRAAEVDGQIVYYPAMGLSLTFDHRALDGSLAARFLKDLRNALENFELLLSKG